MQTKERQQHDQVLDRRETGGGRCNWELKCICVCGVGRGYAKCCVCLGDGLSDYTENWEWLVFLRTGVPFNIHLFFKTHESSVCESKCTLCVLMTTCGLKRKKINKTRTFGSPLSLTIYIISSRLGEITNQACSILLSHENGRLNNWINQPHFKWLEM